MKIDAEASFPSLEPIGHYGLSGKSSCCNGMIGVGQIVLFNLNNSLNTMELLNDPGKKLRYLARHRRRRRSPHPRTPSVPLERSIT